MKILLIDAVMYGHHKTYFEALMEELGKKYQVVGVVPCEYENSNYVLDYATFYKKDMSAKDMHGIAYLKWLCRINQIVKKEKPDIVHFLYGDILYRYFGVGLGLFRNVKVIVTFHQVRRSRIRDFSVRRICRKIAVGILHTDKLVDDFKKLEIANVEKIEYPYFGEEEEFSQEYACRALGINADKKPILLAFGGTRYDKGLDILLEALNWVRVPFYLLIAGYPEMYDETYIREHAAGYICQVKYILKYLSKEELSLCFAASDFIVLPYRKTFDGASGPLGEGVAKNKVIIGPNHGSLGTIISQNHLGYLFESENSRDLANTIEKAMQSAFPYDKKYMEYKEAISLNQFIKSYMRIYEESNK